MPSEKYSRSPKQTRSRESFERVLDVATALLAQHGYYGFSIVDVGRRAKISIGSIYGRVSSKDDLVRSVQERAFTRTDKDEKLFVAALESRDLKLDVVLRTLVEHLAAYLEKNAGLLHAFIARASQDPIIRARGQHSHDSAVDGFCRLLLKRRAEIRHPDPERAALACCHMMWWSFSSYLGLETEEPQSKGDWNDLIEDTYQMALFYLIAPSRPVAPALLKGRKPVSASGSKKQTAKAPKKAAKITRK